MANIEMYTRPGCGYCLHAKRLLRSKGLEYTEHNVYEDPKAQQAMQHRTQGRDLPQIFVNGQSIGGFEELLKLEHLNQLPKQETKNGEQHDNI